LVSDRSWLFRR